MEQELIELIKTNQERYYRVAFTYVKNKEDALDVVHNAIVKALQKIDQLQKKEYLGTWFYRILINEGISFIRKRRNIIELDGLPESQIPVTKDIDKEQHMTLYAAIDQLPLKYKTVIILRFFEDLKLEEIAKITETNLSTVKSRLYKALELLRMDIEEIEYD